MILLSDLTWNTLVETEFAKPYGRALSTWVAKSYTNESIFPQREHIFAALEHTPFRTTNVVILGQDPYHGVGQAHGLAFSVPDGQKIPPSLRNIYKEIATDTGTNPPLSGNLQRWAEQGVLLLNSTLTVKAGEAGSHQKLGWEELTDAIIKKISDEKEGVVFMLWGKYAHVKGAMIDGGKHLVLTAAHPSPLSAYHGFFGCKHFSQCNAYLAAHGKKEIQW